MLRLFIFSLAIAVMFVYSSASAQNKFTWPNGAKAAVVFTYDDALDGQLDNAVPQLDKYGFKGTFYLTGNSPCLHNRLDEWRAIAANGHELGNHTLFHPCNAENMDWVKPEYDLRNYTIPQIVSEMQVANTLLKAIDGKDERTLAYTCCHTAAGGQSFIDSVKTMFVAARGGSALPQSMQNYNVYNTPATMVDSPTLEEMIAILDAAKEKGTIAVMLFHGVGDSYLNVDPEVHEQFLQYIDAHKADFYTGTFMQVMQYIKSVH